MKTFYSPVDLRSRVEMTRFLANHFRYPTMNSWNRSTSYACNLKIYRLDLPCEIEDKLYDMIQTQEFFDVQRDLLWKFGEEHSFLWQAGMNGCNGGYLVLYQGERRLSNYRSYCMYCGQKNYQEATENENICGVCRRPMRVNFPHPHMEVVTWLGRGTDDDVDFEDWHIDVIRQRVRLVQELDLLADKLVEQAVYLVRNCDVMGKEYFVPQKRKVLVESAM